MSNWAIKKEAHRALDDIRESESIEELKYYKKVIFKEREWKLSNPGKE